MNQTAELGNKLNEMGTTEMDDDKLIAAVGGGDHVALRVLFTRHATWIAARLRRSLPAFAVEDVLQETFIAAWQGAATYKGEGTVGAWLWGIARRQVALWLRRQQQPGVMLPSSLATQDDDPANSAINHVDLEQALTTLAQNSPAQRELAQLVLVEERPLAEVAAQLGIPTGTVKSRLHKIRHLLRAMLRQGDEDERTSG